MCHREVHTPIADRVELDRGGGLWSLSDSSAEAGSALGKVSSEEKKFRYPYSSNHRAQQEAGSTVAVNEASGSMELEERGSLSPLHGLDLSGMVTAGDVSTFVEEIPVSARGEDESLRDLQQQLDK
jgi:hypothetical protein